MKALFPELQKLERGRSKFLYFTQKLSWPDEMPYNKKKNEVYFIGSKGGISPIEPNQT